MKVLILGFSDIAQRKVIPAIEKIDIISEIEIASKSKKIKSKGKIKKYYSSYKEAIIKSDAEVVYISLPNSLHFKYGEICLHNNKHVIIDKPSVLTKKELNRLFNLSNQKNLSISESTVYSHHKALNKFVSMNQKERGTLIATFTVPRLGVDNFRNSVSLGGGAINDMGVYAASIGSIFWNTYSKSLNLSNFKRRNLSIGFSIIANYGKGKDMIGYFGFEKNYSNKVTFIGSSQTITLDRVFSAPPSFDSHIIINKNNKIKKINVGFDDSFYNYLLDLMEKITTGKLKLLNNNFYKSNLESLKILEAGNK